VRVGASAAEIRSPFLLIRGSSSAFRPEQRPLLRLSSRDRLLKNFASVFAKVFQWLLLVRI
jgi:hypothetical protein